MNKKQITDWLYTYNVRNYIINDDLTVDVDGNVTLIFKRLNEIGVKFNIVNGDFDISGNSLKNLQNCPNIVNGDFNCNNNKLENLDECPKEIHGNFTLNYNHIKDFSVKSIVHKNIYALNNPIYNLNNTSIKCYGTINVDNIIDELEYLVKNEIAFINETNKYDGEKIASLVLNPFTLIIDGKKLSSFLLSEKLTQTLHKTVDEKIQIINKI